MNICCFVMFERGLGWGWMQVKVVFGLAGLWLFSTAEGWRV
jgi:hypothetical protein